MRHAIRRGAAGPLLVAFGATNRRSYVDVGPDRVEVVFGPSRHVLSRDEIISVTRMRWSLLGGIGWRIGPDTLALIGSLDGVVELRLSKKHLHHVLLVPMGFHRLCVSMEDPEALIRDLDAGDEGLGERGHAGLPSGGSF